MTIEIQEWNNVRRRYDHNDRATKHFARYGVSVLYPSILGLWEACHSRCSCPAFISLMKQQKANEDQSCTLATLRDTLMPKLLNGMPSIQT